MQDFIVTTSVWIGPDLAQAERRLVEDMAPHDVDEASLAQFEAFLPVGAVDRVGGSCGETEPASIGSLSSTAVRTVDIHDAAMPQNAAGGRPRDAAARQDDAIVSSYTIHHARLGVLHVQQSNGCRGAVDAVTLRTDDDALRARLRDAMPALRGALGGGVGSGPDIRVDA